VIAPDFGSHIFWMSNIGLVISPTPILHPNLEGSASRGRFQLYRVPRQHGVLSPVAKRNESRAWRYLFNHARGIRPVRQATKAMRWNSRFTIIRY